MDNILKYLEKTAERFPDKTAVDDGTVQFTYQELLDKARHFGLSFLDKTMPGRPVAILRGPCSYVWYSLCRMLLCNDRSGAATGETEGYLKCP